MIRKMMIILLIIGVTSIAAGCAVSHLRMYDGPAQPPEKVAVLKVKVGSDAPITVKRVNGKEVQLADNIEFLPGWHRLTLAYYDTSPAGGTRVQVIKSEDVELSFLASAGRNYTIVSAWKASIDDSMGDLAALIKERDSIDLNVGTQRPVGFWRPEVVEWDCLSRMDTNELCTQPDDLDKMIGCALSKKDTATYAVFLQGAGTEELAKYHRACVVSTTFNPRLLAPPGTQPDTPSSSADAKSKAEACCDGCRKGGKNADVVEMCCATCRTMFKLQP